MSDTEPQFSQSQPPVHGAGTCLDWAGTFRSAASMHAGAANDRVSGMPVPRDKLTPLLLAAVAACGGQVTHADLRSMRPVEFLIRCPLARGTPVGLRFNGTARRSSSSGRQGPLALFTVQVEHSSLIRHLMAIGVAAVVFLLAGSRTVTLLGCLTLATTALLWFAHRRGPAALQAKLQRALDEQLRNTRKSSAAGVKS